MSQKSKSSNKLFAVVIIALAVAVFAVTAFFSKPQKSDPPPAPPEASSLEQATDPSLLMRPHSPVKGSLSAKVTIVEFLDPECEACAAMHPIMKRLMAEFGDQIKVVTRYMPFHGDSRFAASVLEESRDDGKYDQAMDVLFEKLPEWGSHHQPRPELIVGYIEKLGVDKSRLEKEAVMAKHKWKIDMDEADGMKLGVNATPTFFVNGRMLQDIGYAPIKQAIQDALGAR